MTTHDNEGCKCPEGSDRRFCLGKDDGFPCPHGRMPMDGFDGWRHCPHCLGLNA
mgnify:FL=1